MRLETRYPRRALDKALVPAALAMLLSVVLSTALGAQGDFEVPTRAPADAPSVARMVDDKEPGERLLVRAQVLTEHGLPVRGASVFAYQTDANGIYSEVGNRRPRLRGYARTDESGRFELQTIRPASYPDSRVQQHIHFHLSLGDADARETVGEIVFDDDPLLGERMRRDPANAVCAPRADAGTLSCTVTLRLRG
jgi:protocatechuate 3,4-dioxygenase beta subunit